MSYHYNTSKRLFNESSDADTSDNETKPCETNFIIIHFGSKGKCTVLRRRDLVRSRWDQPY